MRPILEATNEDIAAIYAYLTVTNPRPGAAAAARGRGAWRRRRALPPGPVVA